ncbi:MAG: hypothetical protein U1E76_12270 [Planctomycetota bacterium]
MRQVGCACSTRSGKRRSAQPWCRTTSKYEPASSEIAAGSVPASDASPNISG